MQFSNFLKLFNSLSFCVFRWITSSNVLFKVQRGKKTLKLGTSIYKDKDYEYIYM